MSKLEKIENSVAEFTFEVSSEAFEKGMDKAFAKNAKYFAVPGFRKGKAPRKMVEKMYGRGVLYEDALNFALPDEYDKAVEELKLEPVDKPEIDLDGDIVDGESIKIIAKVTVKPEVKLGKYKGITLEKVEYNVSSKDVDAEIEKLRENGARLETVEDRPVANGDIANIDYEGFKDGVAFDGGKGEAYDLTIGSGQFIPGFEDQLIGANAGDEVTVKVKFPEEYHSEELKGADAEFKVKVNAIKVKVLPELDDEFAKDVSEFETFKELKADIKKKLKEQAEARAKNEMNASAIEKVSELTKVEIPQCMIDSQLNTMMNDYDMRMQQQGLSLKQYFQMTGMTEDTFKKQFAEQAKNQVITTLTLDEIGKKEKIDAYADDIEAEYTKIAESYGMKAEQIKGYIPEDDIKKDIITRKVVDLIVENATVTEKSEEKPKKAPAKKAAAKKDDDGEKAEKKPAAKKTTAKKTTAKKAEKKDEE